MNVDYYGNIENSADFKTFSFISSGPKGDLLKIVQFIPFYLVPGSHNLALGTMRNNKVDHTETTNNGDRDQILATIFYIVSAFSFHYPDQKIHISGRNNATTRLYRGAINHDYQEIIKLFKVYGGIYLEKQAMYNFELFKQSGHYDAFLFERR